MVIFSVRTTLKESVTKKERLIEKMFLMTNRLRLSYLYKICVSTSSKRYHSVNISLNLYSFTILWCCCIPFGQPGLPLPVLKQKESDHCQFYNE